MKNWMLLLAWVVLGANSLWAGPIYYLFDGDASTGQRVDVTGGTVANFTTISSGYPVAITGGTIRLHHRGDSSTTGGVEYDLSGLPTGNAFLGNDTADIEQMLDGTSDGTFNYAVQCCATTNRVWRASLAWQGFTPLFDLPADGGGITYDPVSATLFVLLFDGTLRQYSLTGTLLDSWPLNGPDSALAYDWATDSLFAHANGTQEIYQLSKTGEILNFYTLTGLSNNIWGGEIAPQDDGAVPEPGTAGLLALGLLVAVAARRRAR